MSRLQHFLQSFFSPYKIIVLIFGIGFTVVDFAWVPVRIGLISEAAPAVAVTHSGPTNTPTWTTTGTPSPSPSPVTVSMTTIAGAPGTVVAMPLTASNTTGRGITSYEFQISYDPTVVQPASPAFDLTGTLSSGMMITPNAPEPGHFYVNAFTAVPLTGAGTLIYLRFNIVGVPPQFSFLRFQDYTDPGGGHHHGFEWNGGDPPAQTFDGTISVTQTPSPTVSPTPFPVCSPLVLWDQITGGTGTNGTASQDFETANDAFDAEVADDFQLGSGTAVVIRKIIARGIYFNGSGPADSFNVRFYYGCSLPCGLDREFTGLSYTQDGDKFIIDIPNYSTGNLTGWVSVQARMDFSPGGQWAWLNREQYQFMTPSTWKNPGGGYSIPQCVSFAKRGATCNIDPAYPDQAFQIIGYRPAGACAVPSPTPTSASISGAVTYGNAIPATVRPVSNVLVTGAGSVNVSTTTGSPDGNYQLTGFGSGSYLVTPSKTGGVNSITSFDAARIAQHVAGANVLTGNQLIVADVSGNGSVSSFDAGQIARYVAAVSGFGTTGNWKFRPVNRSYASVSSSISNEDYISLLMGEVSGNWTNSGARPESGRQAAPSDETSDIVVGLPDVTAELGKEILIPVDVRGSANKGIISYEFDLKFDPTVIQPQKDPVDLTSTVSRSLTAVTNGEKPGVLRVVVYGPFPITNEGLLLNLRFNAVGMQGSSSSITWERVMFNEGEPRAGTVDGKVELF